MSRPGERLSSLDLLRAIAIVLVVFFHAGYVHQFGWMGVDLFFVLSGYLIANQVFGQFQSGDFSFKRFYRRRWLRTLPAYFVVLLLYVAWPGFRELPVLPPLWKCLLFIQNFDLWGKAFSHAWSLCIEEQFYLLFPLVALFLARRARPLWIIGFLFTLLVAGFYVRGFAWLAAIKSADFTGDYYRFIYYPTWSRLDPLVLGVSVALLQRFRPAAWAHLQEKSNTVLVAGLGTFALACALFYDRLSIPAAIFGYPLLALAFAFIVASAACGNSILSKKRIPGVETLALISYSLYLVHKEIFHLVRPLVDSLSVSFAASLLAASVLYITIERPFMRLR